MESICYGILQKQIRNAIFYCWPLDRRKFPISVLCLDNPISLDRSQRAFLELPVQEFNARHICNVQMEPDIANMKEVKAEGQGEPEDSIRFCRICELACPVGKAG